MTRLSQLGVGVPAYAGFAARTPPAPALTLRYPFMDVSRETRVISDVADLLHEVPPSPETERKIKRWIQHVLWDAEERRRWWFLEALSARVLNVGDDVIDLQGHVANVVAVWAPKRLRLATLGEIQDLRQRAAASASPAGGEPTRYALEAGRRVHLWPAPVTLTAIAVLYTRPMHVAIVPDNWEGIILDGIIGMYGRHFDRDALSQDPADFETRYEARLRRSAVVTGHFDVETVERWMVDCTNQAVTAASSQGGSTTLLVPASLRGIDYDSVDDGYYPMEVA